MWLTLGVSCTLRATGEPTGGLTIAGRELFISGLPVELASLASSIRLQVDGKLAAAKSPLGPAALRGRVSLVVAADVPLVLEVAPGLETVVNAILEQTLRRLERTLRLELLNDYELWVAESLRSQGQTAGTGK